MRHHHHHRSSVRIPISSAAGQMITIVVLFGVGMLLLGMGVVFGTVAFEVPMLRMGFSGSAVTLGIVGSGMIAGGIFMVIRRAMNNRIRAEGVPGQAQIVGMRQTNMRVNGSPVVELDLQVTTAMHPMFAVTRREVVPYGMLGRIAHGQSVPVMADRARPDQLVILWESLG